MIRKGLAKAPGRARRGGPRFWVPSAEAAAEDRAWVRRAQGRVARDRAWVRRWLREAHEEEETA